MTETAFVRRYAIRNETFAFLGSGASGRPLLVRDGEMDPEKDRNSVLEKYFNDVYVLFLNKLTRFALASRTSSEEKMRLRLLLDEMIQTREILEEE